MHVLLDVSRLLLCTFRPAPAGIDRVEYAYARRWVAQPDRCTFVAQTAWGGLAQIPHHRIQELLGNLGTFWAAGSSARRARDRARGEAIALHAGMALGEGSLALHRRLKQIGRAAYVLASHHALERSGLVRALRARGIAFVPMLHDLIPTTHPEYARPAQVAKHARRIVTTATLADGVIVNSAATADALLNHLPQGGRPVPPIAVARLGLEPRPGVRPVPAGGAQPYFVALGTIEPRKNHLLLLNLWRDLAARLGQDAPRLLVIGRRGWENEMVLDMLDRCQNLAGLVRETGPLPDAEVSRLLAGAQALLFPSFAEGYGLPLAEALALGVPALCSDLPALREVGGEVPEFLDPMDGPAWREAVLRYAEPGSPRRAAQLARLSTWRAPSWDEHFQQVDRLLARVAAHPTQDRGWILPETAPARTTAPEPALARSIPVSPLA